MTILFIVLTGVGVVYAVILLMGMADVDIPGIDLPELDTGAEVKIPSLSPIAIASFITAFGAFGLIGQWLANGSGVWSLVSAAIGGFIVAALAHLAFVYFLLKPQGSSEVTLKDIVGAVGEVITPIPADSVGEVALVAQGGRVTYPAKSASGQPISRNTTVVIERMIGGIAFVRPQ